jgi:tetratricopeptide (TPR) repeat protein
VAGSIGWAARDRAARLAATTEVVLAELDEADSWQEQRRLPEALSAARRADGLLAGAAVEESLRQRVRARLTDLELLDRLENIRLEQGTEVKGNGFDWERVDALYRKTFLDAGLDIEGLPPEEAGERIRTTTVAAELAAVLDDWAPICLKKKGKNDQGWKHLHRVARAADLDPRRMQVREAIEREDWKELRQLAASEEVFRLPPATLSVVGSNLLQDAGTDRVIETFLREAQRRHPNDYWLNHNLYILYSDFQPPQWDEQVRFATVAVALRPDSPAPHNHLGNALRGKGRLDEAIAEYREALRLNKDYPMAHNNLGAALGAKGRHDEAIAEYREAIRLDPSYAKAHHNLGGHLGKLGRGEEGIAETRKALRLNKDFPEAHYNLGNYLAQKGQLDEAIVEYRETIRLTKSYAEAHCNLGRALQLKGQSAEALVSLRRGHELGTKDPQWRYPSAQWVQECQRLLELDRKLPAILSGKQQPADVGERLALAQLCQLPNKKRYRTALRFFEEAFAADPKLTGDQPSTFRYNAACAAALAGCGQGTDADKLDAKERARLRQQALDWLRADLKAWRQTLDRSPDKAGPAVEQKMQHWLSDGDLL